MVLKFFNIYLKDELEVFTACEESRSYNQFSQLGVREREDKDGEL
jgi:hypothetical protein